MLTLLQCTTVRIAINLSRTLVPARSASATMLSGAAAITPNCSKRVRSQMLSLTLHPSPVLTSTGGSSSCMACRNSDEQSDQRHRNIAELIRKLEETQSSPAFQSPKTPMLSRHNSNAASGSISKKDRKAAKKAAKAADRPKFVTAKEVKRVGDVLHPQEEDAEEFEKALLEDENINENLYYHSGTANTVEMRHSFIRQERSGKPDLIVEKAEVDRIMAELKVVDAGEVKDKQTRALITSIAKAVEEDLIHVHNEERLIMRRKGGFWRWASRKAYDRLCANNRIWDWKNGESTVPDKAEAAEPAVNEDLQLDEDVVQGDAMELDATEEWARAIGGLRSNSIDTSGSEISGEGLSATSGNQRKSSIRSDASTDRTSVDSGSHDGWSTVGKSGKFSSTPEAKGPPMKLKLSLNGGLDKMISSKPTPKTPKSKFATWSDEKENEANEDVNGDDECDASPLTVLYAKHFPRN